MKKIRILFLVLTIFVLSVFITACNKPQYLRSTSEGDQNGIEECSKIGHSFENGECTRCDVDFSDAIKFELSEDESSYIIIDGKSCKDEEIIIPSEYNGKPVTAIGEGAFYYCSSAKKVNIPASITVIDEGAFHRCYNLETVIFSEDSQLESIGDSAFLFCDKLSSINIPANIISIGEGAFLHCFNLYEITLPDEILHIGINAFTYTGYYNNSDNWKNGQTLYIGKHFVSLSGSLSGTKFIVDEGTKVIADGVFSECTTLRNVDIPSSVTSIGVYAFKGCSSLEYVNFATGSELKIIYEKAFFNCNNLSRINYGNSKSEWEAVVKQTDWDKSASKFTVHCFDGDILK